MKSRLSERNGVLMLLWLAVCLLAMPFKPVWAWSDFVHESICAQAYQRLSPTAKRLVLSLSQGENQAEGYADFAKSCTWADQVRHESHRATYEYHFINVPKGEDFVPQRDCAAYDCASQAIQRYALYLSDPQRRPQQRAEALRFLGHFIGDLHQPLHVGNKEDRGGNDIQVFWRDQQQPERLHALWDGRIAEELGLLDAANWMTLMTSVDAAQVQQWSNLRLNQWAEESLKLAREQAYRSFAGIELKAGERLGNDYIERAGPAVQLRLQQAIVRLAYVIERASAGRLSGEDFNE